MKRKKGGRPSKLEYDTYVFVINNAAKGMPLNIVCSIAEISYSTLAHWRRRGKADMLHNNKTSYSLFASALDEAIATAKAQRRTERLCGFGSWRW